MDIELAGERHIVRALEEFGPRVQRRILRKAVTAGAAAIVKRARRMAPAGESRALRKSMGKTRARILGGSVVVIAGPRVGMAPHYGIIEWGSQYVAPTGFFARAVQQSRSAVASAIEHKTRVEIPKEAAKLRRMA